MLAPLSRWLRTCGIVDSVPQRRNIPILRTHRFNRFDELESRDVPSTVTFNFLNQTNLGSSVPIYVAMYGQENGNWGEYDLSGNFTQFTNSITQVTSYKLTSGSQSVPFANDNSDTRTNSGRVVFGVGTPPVLTVNANNGGVNAPNLGNPSDPNADVFYDFVEFTLRASDGALFINTSTIDQFGIPLTVTIVPVDTSAPNGVGVYPNRDSVFTQFSSYINGIVAQNSAASAFLDLTNSDFIGSGTLNGTSYPYRIIAPKDLVQFTHTLDNQPYTSPFTTYYNDALNSLFNTTTPISLQVPNPNFGQTPNTINPNDPQTYTFTGTSTTVTAEGSDSQNHSYRVLQFSSTVAGVSTKLNVYLPLFSTNTTNGSLPPAPKFLPNPVESPGQMVLGNDGVFADNTFQFSGSDPSSSTTSLDNLLSNLLANIENQLVSALNRGVWQLPVSDWQDPTKYYAPTSTANFYSGFLHLTSVSIDGKAYGFPYDDQAGQSSTMSVSNPQSVTVTLQPWMTNPPANGLAGSLLVGGGLNGQSKILVPEPSAKGYKTPGETVELISGYTGPVRVAVADITGDGVPDHIAGVGPGHGSRVVVRDGVTNQILFDHVLFESEFTGGVFLSGGDFTNDGHSELIVTGDTGAGARVIVLRGNAVAEGRIERLADFFGLADLNGEPDTTFRGGSRPAVGDLNGDGILELMIAAGNGGGPRVTAWDGRGLQNADGGKPTLNPILNTFLFEETVRDGVYITAGDINGTGLTNLIAGGGPNSGPRVRIFHSRELLETQSGDRSEFASFFAGNPDSRGGIRVAVRNVDQDNLADLITGSGDGLRSEILALTGQTLRDSPSNPTPVFQYDPFETVLPSGVFVG